MDFPSFDLRGRVALITGADKGIGQGIALGLAHAGADVAVTTRLLPRAEKTVQMVAELGRQAFAAELDVTQLEQIQPAVDQVLDRFGRIDILVNNAGYNFTQHPFEVTPEIWDAVYDTNVKGLFFMTQAVGKVMANQPATQKVKGKIINIASQAAFAAMPNRVAYCSSKAAVVHMTRVLALEFARIPILVNAVAPTFVKTELTSGFLADQDFFKYVTESILLDRLGTPEDVAGAVVYLASSAADLVTGHTLVVDGGWTIH